ncbi:hypothetical protein EON80_03575 [bacterium]|nr:MAG: hypothetical protein EON80_03575 [bacterium]
MRLSQERIAFYLIGIMAIFFLAWTAYTAVPFTYVKMAALGCCLFLLLGIALAFKYGKWFSILTTLSLILIAAWPAQPVDSGQLRKQYVRSMRAYRETPYVWGGENGRGIDCSGLMRRGMIDALLAEGWADRNPALWREAGVIWWKDCSAREMKNGFSGRIEPVFEVRSLNTLSDQRLQMGDLAVTKSGVHVLAYVGDGTWIQADPNLANGGNKVIETKAPSKNGWFGQRVVICRWKDL